MRVIGIDPGYDRLGVAVLERSNGNEVLIHSVCIETDRQQDLNTRLFSLGQKLEEIFSTYKPEKLGIETLFFNTNQKTALGVAAARGVVLYIAQTHGCTVREFGPAEVKVAVTGYGKSDKTAVITMVKRLLPAAPEKAHDDEYDAIAVGITCLAHRE